MNNYSIDINSLQINIAIYKFINNEIFFLDLNKTAEYTETINKEQVIGKKLIDIFPGVKEFGLYDVLFRVYKSGKNLWPRHAGAN